MRNNLLKLLLVVSIATLFGCSQSSDDESKPVNAAPVVAETAPVKAAEATPVVTEEKKDDYGAVFVAADGHSSGHDLNLIFTDENKYFQYINLKSIVRNGDIVSATQIFDFQGDMLKEKQKLNFSSMMSKWEFNCQDNTYRMGRSAGINGPMGNGPVIGTELGNSNWEAVNVGTASDGALKFLCNYNP